MEKKKLGRGVSTLAKTNNNNVLAQGDDIAELKALHGEVLQAARMSLTKAIRMGEILTRLKEHCGHGRWQKFITDNLPFDSRSATNYMRCFESRVELLKSEIDSDLGLTAAYRKLRVSSKTPAHRPSGANNDASPSTTSKRPVGGAADEVGAIEPQQQASEDVEVDTVQPGRGNAPAVLPPPVGTSVKEAAAEAQGVAGGDEVRESEQIVLLLLNGQSVPGWHDGVITTEKVQREFRKIERAPGSDSPAARLAQQRVFAAAAREINQVCGQNPTDDVLKAIETALAELRNVVVTHPNYRR